MEHVQYLTAEGLTTLRKEYETLKDKTIPDIATRIDEAKQQGDLSENAEYHAAKEEMAWAQGRLQELQYILDHAEVVELKPSNDTVNVGSTVTVKMMNSTIKTYTIVGPQEADPIAGRISNESPLGQAFLGHKVGDQVAVRTPAGNQTYEITKIQ